MYINHGGRFAAVEQKKLYIGGFLVPRLDLNADKFGYLELEGEIAKLGYISWKRYRVPNTFQYEELKNDRDVMRMLSYVNDSCRVFHIGWGWWGWG